MAELTAADVTVEMHRGMDVMYQDSGLKMVLADVTFGDGELTYPEDGVPLPTAGHFDLKNIRYGGVQGGIFSNGYAHDYDREHHTLRIYDPSSGSEESAGFAPDETTITLALWGK